MQSGGSDFVAHYIAFQKIDPVYLDKLTPQQKKEVASELINWADVNPGHYGDFARAASNILSRVQPAPQFRITLPKNTWIAGIVMLGLAAIVSLYKQYTTTPQDENDKTDQAKETESKSDVFNLENVSNTK